MPYGVVSPRRSNQGIGLKLGQVIITFVHHIDDVLHVGRHPQAEVVVVFIYIYTF